MKRDSVCRYGLMRVTCIGATLVLVLPALATVLGAVATPAAAATPPPYKSSQTFIFPGFTTATFTVPPAVTQVFIDLIGGHGGNGGGSPGVSGGTGGAAADVGIQVGVTPGQTFDVRVGLAGAAGGDNGGNGGRGGYANAGTGFGGTGGGPDTTFSNTAAGAGGGGGASSVLTGGTLLAAAGGGGGGGGGGGIVGYHGGAGGTAGTSVTGGTGGTGLGAGTGGGSRSCDGGMGGSAGGDAPSLSAAGGGGGGGAGYGVTSCGGAGGSAGGSGAGGGGGAGAGASYANDSAVFGSRIKTATTGGDGSVTFTWAQPVSKTTLTASVPATVGAFTSMTAQVSPPSGITQPTPTGTVDFYDGSTLLGSSDLVGGTATFGTAAIGGGTHNLRAAYQGDAVYTSSSGGYTTGAIGKATPVFTTGTRTDQGGFTVVFATVAPPNGAAVGTPPPTGTVKFTFSFNGGTATSDGTYTLDGSNPPQVSYRGAWTGTPGVFDYTPTYSGDANYATATGHFIWVIHGASTTALASSLNPSKAGQSVTFTATVSGTGTRTPTGTVTFTDGSSTLGTGTVGSDGRATLTTAALAKATHTITAAYGGDTVFSGSSTTLTQTVSAAAAPVANAGPDQSVASGATATLDGSGSTDPQNEPLTYTWDLVSGPAVVFDDRHAVQPHVTMPKGPATVTLRVTVTNGAGLTGSDTVVVTVKAPK